MSVPQTDTVVLKQIGRRIADARSAAGLTQAQLAEATGIEPVTISRWETGARSPSVTALVRMAMAMGVEPGALLTSGSSSEPVAKVRIGTSLLEQLAPEQLDLALRLLRAVPSK